MFLATSNPSGKNMSPRNTESFNGISRDHSKKVSQSNKAPPSTGLAAWKAKKMSSTGENEAA
jgi:hypothetical protein